MSGDSGSAGVSGGSGRAFESGGVVIASMQQQQQQQQQTQQKKRKQRRESAYSNPECINRATVVVTITDRVGRSNTSSGAGAFDEVAKRDYVWAVKGVSPVFVYVFWWVVIRDRRIGDEEVAVENVDWGLRRRGGAGRTYKVKKKSCSVSGGGGR